MYVCILFLTILASYLHERAIARMPIFTKPGSCYKDQSDFHEAFPDHLSQSKCVLSGRSTCVLETFFKERQGIGYQVTNSQFVQMSRLFQPDYSSVSSSYRPSFRSLFSTPTSSYGSAHSPSYNPSYGGLNRNSKALPYTRPWNGFNSVVAIHPSQLRQRKYRRYTFDENAFKKPQEFVRVRRVSSTAWETPNSKDSNVQFAKVVDNDNFFRVKIDLNMFEMFEKEEIDVNVYGYDIQIYGEKENPINPNRPLRILNRQYRLPDDVDLKTVNLQRKATEVDVDAKKIPLNYGGPIALRVTDVTAGGQKVEQVHGF
ncbi:unnamed protein product [Bursaphelenchus xylophilus]|uniref:(pine wood nematode) hypothetical protein n=1 Tax=Bursaphelenchus xylophilus TaxID=6326 RepID=A0A1I7RRQ7_BURXY|nr:unnamed protein product [Bursaphelenchus xylophilus]CAG9123543.1 unnamed protein product [Bursaphelenchus xylophilus]